MIKNEREVFGYKLIVGYLGIITMLIGVIIMLPLLTLIVFPEETNNARYFIIPGTLCILLGYLLTLLIKDKRKNQLEKNQDMIIVFATWIIGIVICAIPFILTGEYNFTQAVFETTSGFSTTGLTIVNVTYCPKIFLMYRSILLFFGGVGLVLIMTSVISDSHGMRLYNAEGHNDRLFPNLLKSARVIIAIYSGYIISGTLLYMIFGMNWFDALNHSIAALSTGGFSTKADNIGFYNSIQIEIVSMILMILGCTNFLVHMFLIKGKFKLFFTHCEVKFMLFLFALVIPILGVILFGSITDNISQSFRIAAFQAVTALTTTGFQNVPTFTTWSSPAIFLMILLMLIGGGAGSTAGGIKQYRVYIIMKDIWWSIRDKIINKRIVKVNTINRYGDKDIVTNDEKSMINSFVTLYLCIFLLGTFIYTLYGYSLESSAFEFASALGTVGLSIGITGYHANPVILWTAIIGMFVGRLEIYVVLLSLARLFSDIKKAIIKR